MANLIIDQPDPKLDLWLERIVDVPRELVWRAWTSLRNTSRSGSLLLRGQPWIAKLTFVQEAFSVLS
jgi:hypothetical protein